MKTHYDVLIIGGGASGFFTAIATAEKNPNYAIAILERGSEVLTKVRISGGGRCNVTHACFEPNELTKFYPRGEKELRGPFHQFCSGDTIEWFEKHGVALKIEKDGRMFPESNTSATIIDCFIENAAINKISVLTQQSVQEIYKKENHWQISTQNTSYTADKIVIATGSNPKIWEMVTNLGHTVIEPVPSLFTFNTKDAFITDLAGIATHGTITVNDTKLESEGPVLITHWGFSGPAILKLSAWGARILADKNHQFSIAINWIHESTESAIEQLQKWKNDFAKKNIVNQKPYDIPNRLWERIFEHSAIPSDKKWAEISKKEMQTLALLLTQHTFKIHGKSTFKEEFVTAGGIDLKEINFKTMESKLHPTLYFAGETINVDAITGGFNFQNAWTTGFLVSQAI